MDYSSFRVELITNNEYKTVKKFRPFKYIATIAFYVMAFVIIWRASKKAKRGKYNLEIDWPKSSFDTIMAVEKIGGSVKITGLKNITRLNEPVIYFGNHMSNLENMALPVILTLGNRKISFVVKNELMTYPIFGHVMKATRPISLGRTNPREDLVKVLNEGIELIKRGISVVIYPQGTRMDQINPDDFKSIAAKLAAKSGAPIIPIAIKTDLWKPNPIKAIRDFGSINYRSPVIFEFGEAIYLPEKHTAADEKNAHQKAVDFIVNFHKKWQTKT